MVSTAAPRAKLPFAHYHRQRKGLLYRQWVEERRRMWRRPVATLGYVHMFDMDRAVSINCISTWMPKITAAMEWLWKTQQQRRSVNAYALDVFTRRGYLSSPIGLDYHARENHTRPRSLERPTVLVTTAFAVRRGRFYEGYKALGLGKVWVNRLQDGSSSPQRTVVTARRTHSVLKSE